MDAVRSDNNVQSTTWPSLGFLVVWAVTLCVLVMFTMTLCGWEVNAARSRTQACIYLVFLLRWCLAHKRSERNRIWIAYIVVMVCSLPIWLGIEWLIEFC